MVSPAVTIISDLNYVTYTWKMAVIEIPPTSNKTLPFEQVQNIEHRHIMDTVDSRDADASKNRIRR